MDDQNLPTPHAQGNLEPDRLFFDGDQKIKEGKVTEALTSLFEIIEKYPNYGRAYNHIGYIYETKYRDYARAEQYYKKALEYTPEYPATYLNYAVVLSTTERFDDLQALVMKALKVPGVNKDRLYTEVGIMHEIQGKYEEAIDYYKKAIRYSLTEQDIQVYKKSIERCKMKEEMEFL